MRRRQNRDCRIACEACATTAPKPGSPAADRTGRRDRFRRRLRHELRDAHGALFADGVIAQPAFLPDQIGEERNRQIVVLRRGEQRVAQVIERNFGALIAVAAYRRCRRRYRRRDRHPRTRAAPDRRYCPVSKLRRTYRAAAALRAVKPVAPPGRGLDFDQRRNGIAGRGFENNRRTARNIPAPAPRRKAQASKIANASIGRIPRPLTERGATASQRRRSTWLMKDFPSTCRSCRSKRAAF